LYHKKQYGVAFIYAIIENKIIKIKYRIANTCADVRKTQKDKMQNS
jgi:hypothetical protein